MDSNEQQSLAAAPPIMAAIVPASSSAENAGLWFFLSIMIAPFAWLGWQEYQELKSRSRNVDLLDSLEGSLDRGQLEEELRQIDIEVTQQGEQEVDEVGEVEDAGEEVREEVGPVGESELTEISASAEDDCEYELGVLEDANALLATAGGASRESSAEPRRESAPAAESEAEFSQDDSGESFDLTMLRGVGGVTRNYLVSHGIRNVGDLEDAGAERIREILNEAGAKFQTACPEKWVQQARELLATTR
jgi:predicted flap endonuclease-1-like 5' DNA nuclease